MSKRMPYTAYTVYSGCSWNKFGLISAAIHQEPWEFSFEEFSQIIGKVVGYIIYKQGSSIFHLHVATCTIYVFAAVKRFWATSTPINYSKCDVQRQISSVNVCVPLQYIRKQGSIIKQVKSGKMSVWFSTGIQHGWLQPHQTDPSKWLCTSNICNVCPKMTRTTKTIQQVGDECSGSLRRKKQTDKGRH